MKDRLTCHARGGTKFIQHCQRTMILLGNIAEDAEIEEGLLYS